MNQTFNLQRWALLINMHWSENKKKYFLSLSAIAGLLLIWYGFVLIMLSGRDTISEPAQMVTYFTGLFLSGCFYASVLFADLSNRPKAINYLMLPASLFEKLLTAILFGLVLFFVCYTIIFYLVDISMIKLSNSLYEQYQVKHQLPVTQLGEVINVFVDPNTYSPGKINSYYLFLTVYVIVQSAFLLGSVYFPRYSFLITIISILVIIIFFIFLFTKVYSIFLPEGRYYGFFTSYLLYSESNQGEMIELPHWVDMTTTFFFRYLLVPVLWTATYFRLKEKQI